MYLVRVHSSNPEVGSAFLRVGDLPLECPHLDSAEVVAQSLVAAAEGRVEDFMVMEVWRDMNGAGVPAPISHVEIHRTVVEKTFSIVD